MKNLINKLRLKKINSFVIISIFLILIFTIKILKDDYRSRALKNSLKTYAIVISGPSGSAKGGLSLKFSFKNRLNETIVTKSDGKFKNCRSNLTKGDTIYIKYSISNNFIAEVVYCYWDEMFLEESSVSNE